MNSGGIHAQSGAFELPLSFTLLAFFTFGVTGALAGVRRGYDIIGVAFLALIAAGGGGLIRDGLLLSSGPASILTDARYLFVVLIAVIVTLAFHRQVHRFGRAIAVVDSLGLGAFAVIGVQRTLEAGLSAPAAMLGGTLTAVGGGLLRDVLVREEPLLFKPGQFYALVAVGGAGLYLSLARWSGWTPNRSALVTIAAVFVVRMLAIRYNWRTNPLYREPSQAA
ncbi:MAG: trimeric intracellular cation channel family protein [Planctomycetes bacterium]|nr:trimeric intracellular cation channel family protein [Planctomycetota bacterium]